MTNAEALALEPGDRIRLRADLAVGMHPPVFRVQWVRATPSGQSVVIATTTMRYFVPQEIERAPPMPG